jgi:hypothetical protein
MELQADQRFLASLVKKTQTQLAAFDYDSVSQDVLKMLKKNDFSMISSPDISMLDLDLIYSALVKGRGEGHIFNRNTWLLPSVEEKPLMCIFTSSNFEGQRKNPVVSMNELESARPSLVPPVVTIDWHLSGFSEDNAKCDLNDFACRGPLLLFSDNYLFAAPDGEDAQQVTKDLCRSMLLFIEGLTTDIRDLNQILLLGSTLSRKKLSSTMQLMDGLYKELGSSLAEMGFKGNLLLGMSRKEYKGKQNSKHDRHIFTGAGQIVVTDSLRLFRGDRPYLTESMTLTYRQYTETSTQIHIAKHAKVLLTQLADSNMEYRVGHLNEVLVNNALQQLERD